MSRIKVLALVPFIALFLNASVAHAASPSIVISEIQTGSATSTGQEFVELYNPTANDVAVDGWLLQYKSATSAAAESSWTKRATLAGTVKSHGFYLISQKTYLVVADADLSTTGLSGTGGHVRLKDPAGTIVDSVGWGVTANAAETASASAPAAGQSIERLPGRLIEDGGNSTDTDDNSRDFVLRASPLPQSTASALEEPSAAAPITVDDPPADDQPAAAPQTYAPIMITELMPDPAAPLSDAHDEYIELYNPNPDAVNIKGYSIRAGSNFHSFYILPDEIIAPGAYLAIYASESHVGLTNAGGAAQLLDPAGSIISSADNYGKAITGGSWSLIDVVWKWSIQATPAAENVFVAPLANPVAATATPKAKTSAATTKAKSTTLPKSTTKASKTAATPKASKTKKTTSQPQTALVAASTNHSGAWLLIALAALSIGYAIYEFRHDVRNYYHISKRYLKARGANR